MECPSCSARVPEREIRASREIARCPSCDVTINLARVEGELVVVDFREPPAPAGLNVTVDEAPTATTGSYRSAIRTSGQLAVSFRWFSPIIIGLSFFAFCWDAFLINWYASALSGGSIIMLVFPLIHVAVGVGLTAYVLAGWLNRTRIEVANGEASCVHGPVPMPFIRSSRVSLDDVELFVVGSKTSHPKNKRALLGWTVEARLRSGKKTTFVSRLATEEQARFIQRKLERFLG